MYEWHYGAATTFQRQLVPSGLRAILGTATAASLSRYGSTVVTLIWRSFRYAPMSHESTGAPFNSRTRAARLPDWHSPRLSRRQLSRLIVFLPLNPEEFTTLGDCETYSALLLKCTSAPMPVRL